MLPLSLEETVFNMYEVQKALQISTKMSKTIHEAFYRLRTRVGFHAVLSYLGPYLSRGGDFADQLVRRLFLFSIAVR